MLQYVEDYYLDLTTVPEPAVPSAGVGGTGTGLVAAGSGSGF